MAVTKLLFLDIDGVLNSYQWAVLGHPWGGFDWEVPTFQNTGLDPSCVARVQRIVDTTGASIVIDSAWRVGVPVERFKALLALYGWENAPVIDKTLDSLPAPQEGVSERAAKLQGMESVDQDRGALVNYWRLAHGLARAPYVCIDDMPWRFGSRQPVVATSLEVGITDVDADRAIEILMAKDKL